MKNKINVIVGDITKLKVDAIVNAANKSLRGGCGVDGAIHRTAGPELLEACMEHDGCDTGSCVITPGFNLLAKHVIHTVGPIWNGGHNNEKELLRSCYVSCMMACYKEHFQTVVFPAISCGIYGFPVELAADIAVKAISEVMELNKHRSRTVSLVAFDVKTAKVLENALKSSKE
jgi:O-acetyl-ADP-ribose deacetylase (regulator of RNase III)